MTKNELNRKFGQRVYQVLWMGVLFLLTALTSVGCEFRSMESKNGDQSNQASQSQHYNKIEIQSDSQITLQRNETAIIVALINGRHELQQLIWQKRNESGQWESYQQQGLSLKISNASVSDSGSYRASGVFKTRRGKLYTANSEAVLVSVVGDDSSPNPQPDPQPKLYESLLQDMTPQVISATNDLNGVELGMKFMSNKDGLIHGIRFFRSAESQQNYRISLWTSSGDRLASATVARETSAQAGYRMGIFSQPVTIQKDQVYVASYHVTDGQYPFTTEGFSSRIANASLIGLSGSESGGNGVYAYSSQSTFPTQTYQNNNYHVDVLFEEKINPSEPGPQPDPEPQPEPQPQPNPNPNPQPTGERLPGPSAEMHASRPYYDCVYNRYVSASGSDSNNGTSATNTGNGNGPWKSLQKANNSLPSDASGYCVNILDGEYPTSNLQINRGGKVASKTGFVVYRSVNLLGAKLVPASNSTSGFIQINAPYVIIDGLELDGKRQASINHGIDTCFNPYGYNGVHHVFVFNSYIHHVGGNGIGTCWGEYYWMIHNRSDRNAYNSWNSGISTYQPVEIPGYQETEYDRQFTPYRNVYAYNRFDGNFTDPEKGPHTDGNGLIYDDTRHEQSAPTVTYRHLALIMGNLSTNNGGAGIQVGPTSSNAHVFNNTCYNNYLDTYNTGTWRGELNTAFSSNVVFKNNIGIARPGSGILSNNSPYLSGNPIDASNVFENNIGYGAEAVIYSPNTFSSSDGNRITDPMLVDMESGDFALCTGEGTPASGCTGRSPALGTGVSVPYWHQSTPGAIDMGACPGSAQTCE